MGSINKTIAEPMEVFSLALQKRAVKIMLIHYAKQMFMLSNGLKIYMN
jgi:hypothetical protein